MAFFDPELDPYGSTQASDPNYTPSPYAPPPGTPGVSVNPDPYNPNASANDLGGYTNAPPVDTATGQPDPNWHQDPNSGLWNYGATNTPGAGGTPGTGTGNGDGRPNPSDYGAPGVPGMQPAPNIPLPPGMPDPLAPWTEQFNAPNPQDVLNDPAFQSSLNEGLKQIQRSAASKGTLLTGGTLKGLQDYGQTKANSQYQQVYDNTYNAYDSRRQNFLTNESNRYNSQKANAMDSWQNAMNEYQMQRLGRGDTFDEAAAIFGMQNTNRMNNWGISSDYFNQGQTQRLNDFNIYRTSDMDNFTKNYDLAQLGRPSSPTGA